MQNQVLPQRQPSQRQANRATRRAADRVATEALRMIQLAPINQNNRQSQPSAKTLKNRRRRQKSRQNKSAAITQNTKRDFLEGIAGEDREEQQVLVTTTLPEFCDSYGGVARFNGGVADTPTSTAAIPKIETLAGADMPAEFPIVIMRNSAVAVIYQQNTPAAKVWKYQALMQSLPSQANSIASDRFTVTYNEAPAGQKFPLNPTIWNFAPQGSNDFRKHGDNMLCGISDADHGVGRYIWLDVGDVVRLQAANSDNTFNVDLILDKSEDGHYKPNQLSSGNALMTAGAGGFASVTVTGSSGAGYYRFWLQNVTGSTQQLTDCEFFFSGATASAPLATRHLCMETYCENLNTWPRIAMHGASIRYQNDASVLNLAGSVTVASLPAKSIFYNYLTSTTLGKVAGRKVYGVKQGAQGRLKAALLTDFELQKYHQVADGVITDSYWPIEPIAPFTMLNVKIGDPNSRDCTLELWNAIEFETTDLSRPREISKFSDTTWKNSLQKQFIVPFATENAFHLSDITKSIASAAKSTVNAVLKYGPKVIDYAEKVTGIAKVMAAVV